MTFEEALTAVRHGDLAWRHAWAQHGEHLYLGLDSTGTPHLYVGRRNVTTYALLDSADLLADDWELTPGHDNVPPAIARLSFGRR